MSIALPQPERIACGSSLKFCLLAEGSADLYPRLAPTSEWDIAAGHAVLAAAGGEVVRARRRAAALRPGATFAIPAFIAFGDARNAAADCSDHGASVRSTSGQCRSAASIARVRDCAANAARASAL